MALTTPQKPPDRSASSPEDVLVLAAVRSQRMDGIYDYTRRLADGLNRREDARVELFNPRQKPVACLEGVRTARGSKATVTVVLQYNPFSFGRWGFAPWLPMKMWRMRRRMPELRLALMLHEPYVPIHDWRSALMSAWQRVQLRVLRALSHTILVSIPAWHGYLRGWPRRPVHHLPVGSNVPDRRQRRDVIRKQLGADENTVVLAAFGGANAARLMDYVAAAAEAVAAADIRTILLNLGTGAPAVAVGREIQVFEPGPLEGEDVAAYLAAADLYLAPFIDGVSSRRTTVMAALQHGVPVLGTAGPLTDSAFVSPPEAMILTPVGDRRAFAAAARALARDRSRRRVLSRKGRELYERDFDWDPTAARLLEVLRLQRGAQP